MAWIVGPWLSIGGINLTIMRSAGTAVAKCCGCVTLHFTSAFLSDRNSVFNCGQKLGITADRWIDLVG